MRGADWKVSASSTFHADSAQISQGSDHRERVSRTSSTGLSFTFTLIRSVHLLPGRCHDMTVSYPTAAITETDPFDSFETTGIRIKTDENSVIKSWSFPSPEAEAEGEGETDTLVKTPSGQKGSRKRPSRPPFLEFRFPFNYVSNRSWYWQRDKRY
jgi:hypothetical protein